MRKGIFYFAAALVFLNLGVTFAKIGPKISIDNKYWNFGNVQEGSIEERVFIVENIGDEDLIIEMIFTDCGCTTADISSTRITPQGKAEMKVAYNTKGKSLGQDSKNIYIVSNDSLNPRMNITIEVTIVSDKNSFTRDPVEKGERE